jgi:hypothetical protein
MIKSLGLEVKNTETSANLIKIKNKDSNMFNEQNAFFLCKRNVIFILSLIE